MKRYIVVDNKNWIARLYLCLARLCSWLFKSVSVKTEDEFLLEIMKEEKSGQVISKDEILNKLKS